MFFLIILTGIFLFLYNLGAKSNKANGSGRFLNLTIMVGIASIISWIVVIFSKESVTNDMLIYAFFFAILFMIAVICSYKAYENGSMSGTTIFSNGQLPLIALFGMIFYDEPCTILRIVGLIGILVALVFLTMSEENSNKKDVKFNYTWLLFCLGIVACNTTISILSKIRQSNVGGENPFAYMALCYTFTFIVCLVVYSISQIKNNTIKNDLENVKLCSGSLLLQGFGNAGANLLVMFLISNIDVSLVYPIEIGVGLILSVLWGFIVLKEKKTFQKILGTILGMASIIILSI